MIFGFITLPSASSSMETVGTYSSEMFSALWEPAIIVAGCFIGIAVLIIIKNAFLDSFDELGSGYVSSTFDKEAYYEDLYNWKKAGGEQEGFKKPKKTDYMQTKEDYYANK